MQGSVVWCGVWRVARCGGVAERTQAHNTTRVNHRWCLVTAQTTAGLLMGYKSYNLKEDKALAAAAEALAEALAAAAQEEEVRALSAECET